MLYTAAILSLPITLISELSAVALLDTVDSALCTAAQKMLRAGRWIITYDDPSEWKPTLSDRNVCEGLRLGINDTVMWPFLLCVFSAWSMRRTCSRIHEYLSYLSSPGNASCTTVDLSHSCRPCCIFSNPFFKHESKHGSWKTSFVF